MRFLYFGLAVAILVLQCGGAAIAFQSTSPGAVPPVATSSNDSERGDRAKQDDPQAKETSASPAPDSIEPPSDADKISDLQKTVDSDRAQLEKLRAESVKKEERFVTAEKELKELQSKILENKKKLQELKDDGNEKEADTLEREIQQQEKAEAVAKEGYDQLIQTRKTLAERIAILDKKTADNQQSLDKLKGVPVPKPPEQDGETKEKSSEPTPDEAAKQGPDAEPKAGEDDANTPDESAVEHTSEDVVRAKKESKKKADEAKEAEQDVKDLAERIVELENLIQLAEESRTQVKQRIENLSKDLREKQNSLGGSLITLHIGGVPNDALLGSAAVAGLAVAFAAQNLIRDYFHGVIMMLEHHYVLNDDVTVNGLTGKVDKITLRLTVLRDFEGNTHFIPNGQIATVTNHSHLWSRVMIEIPMSPGQNIDETTGRLLDIVHELRKEPHNDLPEAAREDKRCQASVQFVVVRLLRMVPGNRVRTAGGKPPWQTKRPAIGNSRRRSTRRRSRLGRPPTTA